MVFNPTPDDDNVVVRIAGMNIERVYEFKYLGHIQ